MTYQPLCLIWEQFWHICLYNGDMYDDEIIIEARIQYQIFPVAKKL